MILSIAHYGSLNLGFQHFDTMDWEGKYSAFEFFHFHDKILESQN